MTDDGADARAAAAEALRRLAHTMMTREADDELLSRVAAAADRVTAQLEQADPRHRDLVRLKQSFFPSSIADGAPISHFEECFVSGAHNPLGVGMECVRDGDEVAARVVLGAAFEGAPGRSHGGIVAAVLDDVMGYLLSLHGVPAFTGELTVRYVKPTPVGEPLHLRSRVLSRDGRRMLADAEIRRDDDVLVATGHATFVEVDVSQYRP